jgi:phage baseplate assembly protein W
MTNFSIPFALTPSGSVQVTQDPNVIANNRVESLVGTYPGERVMLNTYGVNVPAYVFAPDIAAQQGLLTNAIQKAVNQWEPSIILDAVTPVVIQSDVGIIDINVEFTLSNNPSLTPTQVATVEIGGNVVQN